MQLQVSALFSLLTVALLAVPALSQITITIIVYQFSLCGGASFTYPNVRPGWCLTNIPTQYGSVVFQGLGQGSVGIGFVGNSCAGQVLFRFSQATCVNLSNRRVGSMSWQRAGGLAQEGLLEGGQTKGPAPSLFTYDDHTGVQNTIIVPADDEYASQKIADLYEAKDFEALAFAVQ